MGNKHATYKVEFSFDKLSLAEQDRLYRKLTSILDRDLKDRMEIKVTDLHGGVHDVFSNKGTRPDGITCENCLYVECGECKVWKKILELQQSVKELDK